MTAPYATAADLYWRAGWRGILPLPPARKGTPPSGYTGANGRYPSYPDVQAWIEDRPAGNISLRMPHDIIGIDVDAYGNKTGDRTIAMNEAMHGPLPATWRSSAREDPRSGIRFYRVPEGLAWPGELDGGGVEIIQHRHRYAVVAPSIHPEGGTYRWYTPDGHVSLTYPNIAELPELPESWVQGLTGGQLAVDSTKVTLGDQEALGWIAGQEDATKPPCEVMRTILPRMIEWTQSAHGSMNTAVLTSVRYTEGGHHGGVTVLGQIREQFRRHVCDPGYDHPRTKPEADAEWLRAVTGAVGIVIGDPGPATCDCFGQLSDQILANAIQQPPVDGTAALQPQPDQPATIEPEEPQNPLKEQLRPGGSFVLDQPDIIPAVWGEDDRVLWAEGESLIIAAPPGVGKTTLAGQIVRGRLGLGGRVLGLPVQPSDGKVLYLAMDRPRQIARSLRRHFSLADRAVLDERLVIWEGPLPGDVAKNTGLLAALAELAEADTIIVDSLKDAAIGLTEDEVGATYNLARQKCLAKGIQVLELHHMVKRGADGKPPTTLADVYGSMHITSGAGSVVVLWGQGGDLVVDFRHLKQPADDCGPMTLLHDHDAGVTSIEQGTSLLEIVAAAGPDGITREQAAEAMFKTEKPGDNDKKKAARQLDKLVADGVVERSDDPARGYRGNAATVWRMAEIKGPRKGPHPISAAEGSADTQGVHSGVKQGSAKGPKGPQAKGPQGDRPLGLVLSPLADQSRSLGDNTEHCNGCGRETFAKVIEDLKGYCVTCHRERGA